MIIIKIFISFEIDFSLFQEYHKNEIKDRSITTCESLLEYTNSVKDTCKLFLPEHGLNLNQQQDLISEIIKNKSISTLKIFTHSPSIFGKGWGDKIIFLDKFSDEELKNII